MSIDRETVKKVANLAKLHVPDAQIAQTTAQLKDILGWVDQLEAVDVAGVAPLECMVDQAVGYRTDVVSDGEIAEGVLQGAPERIQGYFAVPKVIE